MEGNLLDNWGTSTILLLSGKVGYIQSLIKKIKKSIQKMIHQMCTQIWGLKFDETNQDTMDTGGQICPDTTEDSIFSIPLLSLDSN